VTGARARIRTGAWRGLAALVPLTALAWLGFSGPGSAAAASAPPVNSVVPFGTTAVGANAVAGAKAPVVGVAATPDGGGYWLAASDGGIFSYGDAHFYGSTGSLHLNAPIVGMAAAPGGGGYWLVASDGGIFSYGDATFEGSAGSLHLNAPVVGMAATPGGKGYWLVGRDGGTFNYGNAAFDGSAGALDLSAPVTGMAATGDGGGYWLVARDGGVFTYGDARYFGSLGGTTLSGPVVGLAAAAGGAGYWLALGSEPLAGEVVGIDPGHNGLNYSAPGIIDAPVFNGTGEESCDTTGTATDGGYTEAQFNFNVATYLQADLQAEGATVLLTRPNNQGVGPCVTTRAAIINNAHANVAVDIHADGGPVDGRGFAVLEPTADGPNNGVIASSAAFAATLRNVFAAATPMPVSSYDGVDGLQPRNDLAGLNLTTVPKVLIECGNMRNATDAALLVTPAFQQQAAAAMAQAITQFLTGSGG
jgi:N-acetylmuramoyl-L-alanine amidase